MIQKKIKMNDTEENPYSILVGSRSVGDLAVELEFHKKVLRLYLLRLRKLFQEDEDIKHAITIEDKEERRKQILTFVLKIANPGTEDVLEEAINILLNEYEKMKLVPYQQYLIDEQTGMAIMPLTKDSLFQPPDYIGEDGKKHKAQIIVHPGISSAIGLAMQERSKIAAAITKGGPEFEHLKDPSSIIKITKELLESEGFEIGACPNGFIQIYEIGHEHEEGVFQSLNKSFHRYELFGKILAKKIIHDMKNKGISRCELGIPQLMKNNKHRWYTVSVMMKKIEELS